MLECGACCVECQPISIVFYGRIKKWNKKKFHHSNAAPFFCLSFRVFMVCAEAKVRGERYLKKKSVTKNLKSLRIWQHVNIAHNCFGSLRVIYFDSMNGWTLEYRMDTKKKPFFYDFYFFSYNMIFFPSTNKYHHYFINVVSLLSAAEIRPKNVARFCSG